MFSSHLKNISTLHFYSWVDYEGFDILNVRIKFQSALQEHQTKISFVSILLCPVLKTLTSPAINIWHPENSKILIPESKDTQLHQFRGAMNVHECLL